MNRLQTAFSLIAMPALIAFPSLAYAQTSVWFEGRITTIWSDPDALVLSFGTDGPCGSDLYDISRSNSNFQEMSAMMLTAAASGRTVEGYIASCNGTRNVLTKGNVHFQ